MCFCLKRANRLLPNPLSFPLRPRASDRERRRGYDQADEEFGDPESREGLLARQDDFDNDEEDDDPHRLPPRARYHSDDDEEEQQQQTRTTTADTRQSEEEFGDMQGAPASTQPQAAEESASTQAQQKRTPVFNIADEEDEDEPPTK